MTTPEVLAWHPRSQARQCRGRRAAAYADPTYVYEDLANGACAHAQARRYRRSH